MESELEKLKKHMQESINFAIKNNEDLDDASWNYQEGILLSCNEAKLILDALKKLPNESKTVNRNENAGKICICSPTAQVKQNTTGLCSNCFGIIIE